MMFVRFLTVVDVHMSLDHLRPKCRHFSRDEVVEEVTGVVATSNIEVE